MSVSGGTGLAQATSVYGVRLPFAILNPKALPERPPPWRVSSTTPAGLTLSLMPLSDSCKVTVANPQTAARLT